MKAYSIRHNWTLSFMNHCETGTVNFHDLMRSKVSAVRTVSHRGEELNMMIRYIFNIMTYCKRQTHTDRHTMSQV